MMKNETYLSGWVSGWIASGLPGGIISRVAGGILCWIATGLPCGIAGWNLGWFGSSISLRLQGRTEGGLRRRRNTVTNILIHTIFARPKYILTTFLKSVKLIAFLESVKHIRG